MSSDEPQSTTHNGIVVRFIPDDAIEKGHLMIGQCADNLGRRMACWDKWLVVGDDDRAVMR